MKLLNKNVIITGGNQGFGLAVAEAYLKEGANVIICARDEEKLKKATDYLDKFCFQTSQLYSLKADISKPADNKEIVEFALKKFNKILKEKFPTMEHFIFKASFRSIKTFRFHKL